jgi:hypothetical protein
MTKFTTRDGALAEELFRVYCHRKKIKLTRILERAEERTPDFHIRMHGLDIYAEVKQISMTARDEAYYDEVRRNSDAWAALWERREAGELTQEQYAEQVQRHVVVYGREGPEIGKRTHATIRQTDQLTKGAHNLMVIYDATGRGWTDPHAVTTALFGNKVLRIPVHPVNGADMDAATWGFTHKGTIFNSKARSRIGAVMALYASYEPGNSIITPKGLSATMYPNPWPLQEIPLKTLRKLGTITKAYV